MAILKDLIVMGAARFANIIQGSISGNAGSADKVNNAITISSSDGTSVKFDGSAAKTVSFSPSSFGLGNSMRIIGEVDGEILSDTECYYNVQMNGAVALPLRSLYDSSVRLYDYNSKHWYHIKIGDVVRQNTQEYLCVATGLTIGSNLNCSYWIKLGGNDIWNYF